LFSDIPFFFKAKFAFEIFFEQHFEVGCSSQRWVILMLIYYTTMRIIKGHENDSSSEWRKIIPNDYWWVNQDSHVNLLLSISV